MGSLLAGGSILVVEDEVLIALDIQDAFIDVGSAVIIAHSLKEAFDVINLHDWTAAVLDYTLCDGDCVPLCEWFQEHDVPFVVCTGQTRIDESCNPPLQLPKPVNPAVLVQAIERLVAIETSQLTGLRLKRLGLVCGTQLEVGARG